MVAMNNPLFKNDKLTILLFDATDYDSGEDYQYAELTYSLNIMRGFSTGMVKGTITFKVRATIILDDLAGLIKFFDGELDGWQYAFDNSQITLRRWGDSIEVGVTAAMTVADFYVSDSQIITTD